MVNFKAVYSYIYRGWFQSYWGIALLPILYAFFNWIENKVHVDKNIHIIEYYNIERGNRNINTTW